MNRLILIFSIVFFTGYLFSETKAIDTPKTNEMEEMLKNIQSHTKSVAEATHDAHEVSEKLLKKKCAEKKQLQESIKKMEEKIEVYAVKMIGSGMDTTVAMVEFKGQVYDAWLNYVEEGGKEDFEYFRIYIWQQK